jgi:hypothetical protein
MKLTIEVYDEWNDAIYDVAIQALHLSNLLSVATILDIRQDRTTVTSDAQTNYTQNRFTLQWIYGSMSLAYSS